MTSLTCLDLYKNLIGGPLPSSIENLSSLIGLHFDSCNFFGEIPSTFANLTNLNTLLLHGNNFTITNVPDRQLGGDQEYEADDWLENEVQDFLATPKSQKT